MWLPADELVHTTTALREGARRRSPPLAAACLGPSAEEDEMNLPGRFTSLHWLKAGIGPIKAVQSNEFSLIIN